MTCYRANGNDCCPINLYPMKSISLLMIAIGCLITLWGNAQDVHFSQFYENAPLRNPALIGVFSGDYKVAANYRNQWSSFATPFVTALASVEVKTLVQPTTGDFISFGLTAVYDKAGSIDFNSTSVYGGINLNKALGDAHYSYLSVGLGAGYTQRTMNVSKMRFANQYLGGLYNPNNPSGEQLGTNKINNYDVAAGMSFNSSIGWNVNYYIGLGAYHLNKPKQTYIGSEYVRLSTRWSGNFGLRATLSNTYGLMVVVNYQQQEPYQEIIGGALISYLVNNTNSIDQSNKLKVYVGCLYRYKDAIIPTLKLDYRDWGVTCSYDIAMGGKRIYFSGTGGYEMSLVVRGRMNRKHSLVDPLTAPRFELEDDPSKNPY